ncbi:hypothetical protein IMSAGC006_02018 [Muribaculaceae bacterium]|nr:hypothetical protein IMSAGC006_02018 [Muribaculaceae bacterium]
MVCATVNPSLRAASCWSVEVVNGGAGVFLAGLTLMALTEKSAFLQSSRNFCAAFSSVSRLLSSVRRVAPEGVVNMAVTRKYSSDRKFFISSSRSTMSLTATDCTRPAERAGLIFFHSTGLSSNPTMRSSTRRACWALTRSMSMPRGLAMALSMASFVISWNTMRRVLSGLSPSTS